MTAIELATAAQNAALSDYTLRTIARLARPTSAPVLDPPFVWSVLPAWEIQLMGQVRRAGTAANAFLSAIDALDARADDAVAQALGVA